MTPAQARAFGETLGLSLRYALDSSRLPEGGWRVVQFDVDLAAARYIEESRRRRHGRALTWLHRALRGFLSDFDINGYLGTYPMHVLSEEQWRDLLAQEHTEGHLLDIGAGRGDVTSTLAPLFARTTVTETSKAMARRLKRRGYEVICGDIATMQLSEPFDAISLLNVLDRCDRPLSLLGTARTLLREGGLLIIALVLPYRPFVYEGGQSRAPNERLPIRSSSFEEAAGELIELALLSLGLAVVAISRCPYLSGGDAESPLYELDDLIVVCRSLGPPPPILGPSSAGPPSST